MCRFRDISSILMSVFVFLLSMSGPVCADAGSLKHILPTPRFTEDWIVRDDVVLHTKDTLFDHINGEAELYYPYGFQALATATYVHRENPDWWIVADVYRMASLLDAFGIYSNYRKTDAFWVAIGAEGFVSSSQLMFYQDTYFVRLQVTGTTGLKPDILLACGRAISRNLPPNTGHPREVDVLRIPGIVQRSERYIAQSLLGYAFFHRGIIADAMLGGKRVQIFVVSEDSLNAAQKAFDHYRSYLMTEGRSLRLSENPDRTFMEAIDPLYGGVFIEIAGRYILGAVRIQDSSAVEQLLGQLRKELSRR